MNMNTQIGIGLVTKLDINSVIDVSWSEKEQKKNPITLPRAKGEIPYQFEQISEAKQKKFAKSSPQQKSNKQKKMANNNSHYGENSFAHIAPSVREVSGGWNTLSNEAIERRHKERQHKYITENIDLNSSGSNATCTTLSSETTDSFKTAHSYDSITAIRQTESEKFVNDCLDRYKKNALIIGLIRNAQNEYPDKAETSTESSDFQDASECMTDVQNKMTSLSIGKKEDENEMRDDRLGRWFQSREDDDVYLHPLREEIKHDAEWQKQYLQRKGIESTETPRQYYLNVDDDSFTFQPNHSKRVAKPKK